MRYTCEVLIQKPREEVVKLFENPENLSKWQPTLRELIVISGEHGVDGMKSKLIYDENGKEFIMMETIETFNLPEGMTAIYEAKNVWNKCINTFEDLGNQTKWSMDTEFKCTGFMRLMTMFGKSVFTKQTQSDMERFKQFAESIET